MTFKEANDLSFQVKWKVSTCTSGESCWCRTVAPETPIIYDDIEELFIIGMGTVHKEIAEYIVKLHNDNLNNKKNDI